MIAAYYCANCGETHSPGECPKARVQPGCKSICHPDEGHAPDCPNRPPGVREYEELQRDSHPQTWHPQTGDLATVAHVETLRLCVENLTEAQLSAVGAMKGIQGQIDILGKRLAALEALRGEVTQLRADAALWFEQLDSRLAVLEEHAKQKNRRPVSTEGVSDDSASLRSLPDGDEQVAVEAPGRRQR